MSSIALWWRAVRPFSFTVSVIPPILGAVLAVLGNPGLEINWFRLILTLIGCMTAHAGANLLSDYYDYKVHVDREDTFGSSGLLVGKIMQPKQIFKGGVIVISVALGIGLYLVSVTPNGLFLLGLIFIGGILGVFYTAQPFAFKALVPGSTHRSWLAEVLQQLFLQGPAGLDEQALVNRLV